MPTALTVSPLAARRFLRRVHGFDAPFPAIAAALAHHGYIQIDPINVCGRMHDLILRNRVADYREGDLMRLLHGGAAPLGAKARTAFEHHLPHSDVLVAFPLEAWPHLLAAMRGRTRRAGAWSGWLTPRERALAPQLLAEIAHRGPLGSEDFADTRRAHRVVWGKSSLVKSTLQKLFFHGRLLVGQRVAHRRRYDLPERVLPARTLALPEPSAADTARWLALLKLRQRRLATLKREELRVVEDTVQPVAVAGCPPLFCLREDAPLLASLAAERTGTGAALSPTETFPRLLAPLDPLIYDRRVTAALWHFDYTWEAYTPPHKRVRGHYALPVLAGTELVGHVDPKADRAHGKLVVVSRRVRRGYRATPAVRELARFLGLG
ncbi:MAG TPA: crosslink repair DNA glycosylase YcaQ family protein [Opitutaceae bacterium]|nr:crosslink repair DNA glycosylase YcaQ family protein [Opitutaceae bacterium]